MKLVLLAVGLLGLLLTGCPDSWKKDSNDSSETKLVYFGFQDQTAQPDDVAHLAEVWGNNKVCPNWRPTVSAKDADYQVLFRTGGVMVLGRRGEILYNGGDGPLYLPHGNPDGSGINICELTSGR
jgi:hypothetical protein